MTAASRLGEAIWGPCADADPSPLDGTGGYDHPMSMEWAAVRAWSARRWVLAVVGGIAIAVLGAIPTDIIPNPYFTRSMAVTWWSYPVLVMTGFLGVLLVGTYVRDGEAPLDGTGERASRLGLAGAFLTFFAVGCPVCNKLVLIALGASGAMTWFAPFQPVLALASLILMAVAVRVRLRNQSACAVRLEQPDGSDAGELTAR